MKFIVDKEGADALNGLCDVALKQGGLQNMNAVARILSSVRLESEAAMPMVDDCGHTIAKE